MSVRSGRTGSAFLQMGFRPFFLAGPLFSLAAMALWLAVLSGAAVLPGPLDPLSWHGHAMLFGFAGAAVTGFVLTAVPNWTGRLPLSGRPLLLLFLLWLSGRIAVLLPGMPLAAAAAIDLGHFVVLAAVVGREVAAGRNWRNLPVLVALSAFAAADLVAWLEFGGMMAAEGRGIRLGIAVLLMLIGLIGGRIVPSFTRNWLVKQGAERLPVPFGRFDKLALGVSLPAVLAWAWSVEGAATGALLAAAAVAHLLRLARWRGQETLDEPLLWVLHLAYLWLPLGLALAAAAALAPAIVPATAALHALTAGAITLMMVAVMTRATLGHTGRALRADRVTVLLYLLLLVAAVLRIAGAMIPSAFHALIGAAGLFWGVALLLYLANYAPMLLGARKAGP